jgi:pilus assembly protein CpaE
VTTLAVNLAVVLRSLTNESTILVDLSPMLGTAALSIGLQPRYSYLDVVQNFHRIDEALFRSFLETHESGVELLASPPAPDTHAEPSMDEVMGLLRFCRRHYAHVVVDAGHTLSPAAEAALMEADHRLLVTTPELPTLRNLKRVLETIIDHTTNGKAPPRVVLNQYAEGLGVTVTEVRKGLGLEVDAVIERDSSLISESINLGRPAVLMKKSSFDRAMTGLGTRISGPSGVTVQRSGLLKTLLRPFRSAGSAVVAKEAN